MPRFVLSCSVIIVQTLSTLSLSVVAPCTNDDFNIDYSPERCGQDGGPSSPMNMVCDSRDPNQCGMRMSSKLGYGTGKFSADMKAAPGSGTATRFYLYSFGRQNSSNSPWNEVDMEILGKHIGNTSTQIWTNYFAGRAEQFPQFITVPFDVSADFHTYDIEVTCCDIKWLVDGVTYRTESILLHEDMQSTIASQDFQMIMSLWGQGRGTGDFAEMGFLEENTFQFPLVGSFNNVALPSRKVTDNSTCDCKDGLNAYEIAAIVGGATIGVGAVVGAGFGIANAQSKWDATLQKSHVSLLAPLGICFLMFALLLSIAVLFRRWRRRSTEPRHQERDNLWSVQDFLPLEANETAMLLTDSEIE